MGVASVCIINIHYFKSRLHIRQSKSIKVTQYLPITNNNSKLNLWHTPVGNRAIYCHLNWTPTFHKSCFYLLQWKPFKNDEKYFFISHFILQIFTFLYWLSCMLKNSLIRKLRLISKLMTSQTGQQIITIHILFNASRSKSNQTMKFE